MAKIMVEPRPRDSKSEVDERHCPTYMEMVRSQEMKGAAQRTTRRTACTKTKERGGNPDRAWLAAIVEGCSNERKERETATTVDKRDEERKW